MKPKTPSVTVKDFFTNHAAMLQLRLVAGASGLNRAIREGSVHRPGLALIGFYKHFAHKRVQIIGMNETDYLNSLSVRLQRQRIREFFARKIPCVIFARNQKPPKIFLEEAELHSVAVFVSPRITMRLINAATICMEMDFAPSAIEHGSMVDVQGVGVMIRGKSGIGKSEAVLGLIERGYSLITDDVCKIRCMEGRELVVASPSIIRHHMEIRGIGIINVATTFGVGSIRLEKRLDLIVTLQAWEEAEEIERTGLEQLFYEILGIRLPHVIIPIKSGRDVARLIEVAALDAKLKQMGQHSAQDFNNKLLAAMQNSGVER